MAHVPSRTSSGRAPGPRGGWRAWTCTSPSNPSAATLGARFARRCGWRRAFRWSDSAATNGPRPLLIAVREMKLSALDREDEDWHEDEHEDEGGEEGEEEEERKQQGRLSCAAPPR